MNALDILYNYHFYGATAAYINSIILIIVGTLYLRERIKRKRLKTKDKPSDNEVIENLAKESERA